MEKEIKYYTDDKYLNEFAQKLMNLSNRLNEVEDDDVFRDDLDIKTDYLPDIREFIFRVTGL
jgi:hypothetical protein